MNKFQTRSSIIIVILTTVCLVAAGCVYYNMFFNAKKKFDKAEQQSQKFGGRRAAPQRRAGNMVYQDAIDHFAKVIDRHPKSKWVDDAYYYIGLSYFRMDDFDKSQRSFTQIIENHPKSKYLEEAGFWIAVCRVELGERVAGRERLHRLAETATRKKWRAEAWSRLADMYLQDKEYDSAAAACLRVADKFPSEEIADGARFRAGEALTLAGREEEALAQFHQTLREEPSNELAYRTRIRMADAYFGHDQVDSGLVLLETLAKSDLYFDSLGVLQLKIGHGRKQAGRFEEAIETYTDVTETFPKTGWAAEAYYHIGYLHQKQFFDFPAARDYYDKARQEFSRSEFAQKAINLSVTLATIEGYQGEITKGLAELFAIDNPQEAAAIADSIAAADSSNSADSTAVGDTTRAADSTGAGEFADSETMIDSTAAVATTDETDNPDSTSLPQSADSTSVTDSVLSDDDTSAGEPTDEIADLTGVADSAVSALMPDSSIFPDSGVVASDSTAPPDTMLAADLIDVPDSVADTAVAALEEIKPPDDPNRMADTTVSIDSALVIDTTFVFDTILVADAIPAIDTTKTAPPDVVTDSLALTDTTIAEISGDSTGSPPSADSVAVTDSTLVNNTTGEPDSTLAVDSNALPVAIDSAALMLAADSAAAIDSIPGLDTTLAIDSIPATDAVVAAGLTDSSGTGEEEAGTPAADTPEPTQPAFVIDTTMFFDTSLTIDTTLTIELTEAAKKALAEKKKRDAVIDKLATAYFNLAQAYHTVLEEPDSARFYYDTLICKYPESQHIPRALFASASLLEDNFDDSLGAAEKYQRVLNDYGRTDFAGSAIERLGLAGTPADTGYPGAAYSRAEQVLFDEKRPDSAQVLFESIVREFPESIYAPKAAYASLVAAEESYRGEDSTLYLMFAAFVDSFPGTPYADDAKLKMGSGIAPRKERQRAVIEKETEDASYDSALAAIEAEQGDTTIVRLPRAPRPKQLGQFTYPETELGHDPWKGMVTFKILIDFTGRISQYEMVEPSERQDIDLNATMAVEGTFFDPDSMAPESLNMWYLYEVKVDPGYQEQENIFNDPYQDNR